MAETAPPVTLQPCPAEERIDIGGRAASIRWRRSARARRVALKIDPRDSAIVITLPPRGSRRAGLALLRGHEDWVAARLAALPTLVVIAPGQTIPLCGEPHLIVHDPSHRGRTRIGDARVTVAGAPEFVARRVRDALQAMAFERFSAIAAEKAAMIEARPRLIRIKDTRSRWGSCTSGGVLMFSWRLVMAPDFVQDYVIAHEVAHLRHLNHAAIFWTLSDRLSRHRAEASAWLARHGPGLLRIA